MPARPAAAKFVGRDTEIGSLFTLTDAARQGTGGAFVVRGEPGIGKTTLLRHVERAVSKSFLVVRASGAEFEGELPFATLHQLCVPLLGHLEALSGPYRDSLRAAFGLAEGAPDPFRVGLASLELLAAAAVEHPLLCVIDDAHWMDDASARALTFLARRLSAEPVAMVFAARDRNPVRGLDELPGVGLDGLTDAQARALLAAERTATLDDRVRERILAEARGNPLALIELPKAGGFVLPTPSPVASRIERSFHSRATELPTDARLLLVLASADPTGDPKLLWAAAYRLDLDVSSVAEAAEESGLVRFETRVRFCHPLARSAVYRSADAETRRRAHRALAGAIDPSVAADRQVWHRAQATTGPDERVAAGLEASASRAQARGGVAAAAAFLERAAALSLDPDLRTRRTLSAARATLEAGEAQAATDLIASIDAETLDESEHASVDLLRGRIALSGGADGAGRGPEFMLRAARRLSASEPERARECVVSALEMALVVGKAAGVMDRVLAAARSLPSAPHPPDLLDGLVLLHTKGHQAGAPVLRRALTGDNAGWTRVPALATMLAGELWDMDLYATIVEWLERTGRDTGSPMAIRLGLSQVALSAVFAGDFGRAMAAIAEETAISDAFGDVPQLYSQVHLVTMRGRREEALDLYAEVANKGVGQLAANTDAAVAVLHNALGEYTTALAAAQRTWARGEMFTSGFVLPELIEAAVRCGEQTVAESALASLVERTEHTGTHYGLSVATAARALVHGREDDYQKSVEYLADTWLEPDLARARLRYGEWLRREGRRRDAREQLSTAYDQFARIGMEGFAERAAGELRATGAVVQGRTEHTYDRLTMQEMHIAREVAAGATTKEVAARLFLSPRTIDAHLRNIFRKLGITSRRQLKDLPGVA